MSHPGAVKPSNNRRPTTTFAGLLTLRSLTMIPSVVHGHWALLGFQDKNRVSEGANHKGFYLLSPFPTVSFVAEDFHLPHDQCEFAVLELSVTRCVCFYRRESGWDCVLMTWFFLCFLPKLIESFATEDAHLPQGECDLYNRVGVKRDPLFLYLQTRVGLGSCSTTWVVTSSTSYCGC